MSILIKGMSMPNDGRKWIMFLRLTSGEVELFDPIGEDESAFYEVVELPPHGRLIDADEFYKSLKKWNAKFYSAYEKDKKDERIAALLELDLLVRKVLAGTPTVIPAEEVDK